MNHRTGKSGYKSDQKHQISVAGISHRSMESFTHTSLSLFAHRFRLIKTDQPLITPHQDTFETIILTSNHLLDLIRVAPIDVLF